MQNNILVKVSAPAGFCIKSTIGQQSHVRHHVKMYPWRRSRDYRESYLDPTRTPYTDKYNINEFMQDKRMKKSWQIVIPKDRDSRFNRFKWNDAFQSDPKEAKEVAASHFKRLSQSIKDRGQPRECKPYQPPDDVEEQVISIYKQIQMSNGQNLSTSSTDPQILGINLNENRSLKFDLIARCVQVFGHEFPNSILTDTETIQDVVTHFSTPVRGYNSYTTLANQHSQLPANLTLLPEPIRFDKETDQMFGGKTALPGLVNRVPGLRAAKKYRILNQDEFRWPDI